MTPRLVLCLMACSLDWLPLVLPDKMGRLGWTGCLAYSLCCALACVLVLLPRGVR